MPYDFAFLPIDERLFIAVIYADERLFGIGEGSIVEMVKSLMSGSHEDVVHLFQRHKGCCGTVLFTDDAALVGVQLNTLVAPPCEVFVFWYG